MFYNIFLYFQSQYFLRFYLILHFDQENGLKYLNNENICFRKNIEAHTEKLVSWLYANIHQKYEQRKIDHYRLEGSNMSNLDLSKMKRFSIDLLCRLIAITNKYQSIDEMIHSHKVDTHLNKDDMLKISMELNSMKDSMNACQEDLEALKLINNKCFVQMLQKPIGSSNVLSKNDDEHLSSIPNQSDESYKCITEEESHEYFGINTCEDTEDENTEGKYNVCSLQDDLFNIDNKVTRLCFAPVLKQLKSKIDPIKTEMKERELKYLISKGIDRNKIIEFDENEALEPNSDPMKALTKFQTKLSKDRYDETRKLLQQKQQMMFMSINDLPSQSSLEDILE